MEKSVVVTGCGTGIGRTIFDRLLADGWAVIGLEMQESLAAEARTAAGGRCSRQRRVGDRGCYGGSTRPAAWLG
jgi:NAD(P)-dependent dehydrogenase (short-subunit alcohol dehydrogenase family)